MTAEPDPPPEDDQEADDEREVGAAHRKQVGEPGRPEVVGDLGIESAVVTGDQRRDELAGVDSPVRDRGAHRPTYGCGGVPPDSGLAHHRRRPDRTHECGRVVVRGHQPGGGVEQGAQRRGGPVGGGHDHDRHGDLPCLAPPDHPGRTGPEHLHVAELPGHHPRVGGHLEP